MHNLLFFVSPSERFKLVTYLPSLHSLQSSFESSSLMIVMVSLFYQFALLFVGCLFVHRYFLEMGFLLDIMHIIGNAKSTFWERDCSLLNCDSLWDINHWFLELGIFWGGATCGCFWIYLKWCVHSVQLVADILEWGFKYEDYDQMWFKNESLQILAYGYVGRLRYMILPS